MLSIFIFQVFIVNAPQNYGPFHFRPEHTYILLRVIRIWNVELVAPMYVSALALTIQLECGDGEMSFSESLKDTRGLVQTPKAAKFFHSPQL
jgi:hypothetical protein